MMQYLDLFSRHGIAVSVRDGRTLRLEPGELVSDELASIARAHKDELIAEIRALCNTSDPSSPDVAPAYRFLWVATTLESFEETDPRYGYEVGLDPVFRMLDAPYYAWLRNHMEGARRAHDDGRLPDQDYAVLCDRFNVIHNWAVEHIGVETLRRAIRTTNVKRYVRPSDRTIDEYHRSWDETRRANAARRNTVDIGRITELSDSRLVKLTRLIETQGYAVVRLSALDDIVVIRKDEQAPVPTRWSTTVQFTMAELAHLIGVSDGTLRQIRSIKELFGGTVLGPAENNVGGRSIDMPDGPTAVTQRSLFADQPGV